jgi:hypothetical protein
MKAGDSSSCFNPTSPVAIRLRYDKRGRAKAGMILRMALSFHYKWFIYKSDKFRGTKKLCSFSQGG